MSVLPIDHILPDLLEKLADHSSLIVHAPPGAGKTTRIPLALLAAVPAGAGRIIMLEPRRLAAVSAARFMAASLGEAVGQTVGYSIRFEQRTSAATRIEVVTEGVLTRRIQSDPLLEGVAMVIFDEFHERSLQTDLGLALCREIQQQLRNDLKLLVMSATLDVDLLSRLLDDAPVIRSLGRIFPVHEIYLDERGQTDLIERMKTAVLQALQEQQGDILAFLPGSGEIRRCAERLRAAGLTERGIEIHPLYGDLPFEAQQAAIRPSAARRVVLATSIAETSLTIEGVRIVIDSGLSRRLRFDASCGLDRLVTVRESRASAEQRKGRAGRIAPGVCYRLFSRHTLSAMTAHTPPEILEADLAPLVLELAAWGESVPQRLAWINPPAEAGLEQARCLLNMLGALDTNGVITPRGSRLAAMPLHPRLAALVVRAGELGCAGMGCDLAALLSERDIFRRQLHGAAVIDSHSDLADRLESLYAARRGARAPEHVDAGALKHLERVVEQLRRISACDAAQVSASVGNDSIARLLLTAYPDRLARQREEGSDSYLLANGRGARLSPRCSVRSAAWLVAAALDGGAAGEALIHLASEVTMQQIREELKGQIRSSDEVVWSVSEGRVLAEHRESLGSIVLAARPGQPDAGRILPAVVGALRAERLGQLRLDEQFLQLQGRVRMLRNAWPEADWPDLSIEALLDSLEVWLAPFLSGVRTRQQLAALDICSIIRGGLGYRQQRELDELAPSALEVPSGSRIRLDYSGDVPVLAVKLQELFGLAETPTVAGGRVAVLLHLLSPAGRPLQVTRDLKGFWDGTYCQVKKEMKGRYPRHPWPDDPWSALPTRRVKPRPG